MRPSPGPGTQAPDGRPGAHESGQAPADRGVRCGRRVERLLREVVADRVEPAVDQRARVDGDPPLPVLRRVLVRARLAALGGAQQVEERRPGAHGHPAQRVRQRREQHRAAPLRVGAAVRAALHRVQRDHALGDRRRVGGQHEPPRAVRVARAFHHGLDRADRLLDLRRGGRHPLRDERPHRLAAGRGEHVEEGPDAGDAGGDERGVVVGPDLQHHRRHAVAARDVRELRDLRTLAVLAGGRDVGGVGSRTGQVDRHRRQAGGVDVGARRAVTPVAALAAGARRVVTRTFAGRRAVPQRHHGGLGGGGRGRRGHEGEQDGGDGGEECGEHGAGHGSTVGNAGRS